MYSMALVAITKDLCEASKYNKHKIHKFYKYFFET
jgi:hypothetical protein